MAGQSVNMENVSDPKHFVVLLPHDLKLHGNGVKCQWLHLRDEESADRPNQILPIFCQFLCT